MGDDRPPRMGRGRGYEGGRSYEGGRDDYRKAQPAPGGLQPQFVCYCCSHDFYALSF